MQVQWQKFLAALGCPLSDNKKRTRYTCPIHPGSERTLSIVDDQLTGSTRFTCNHSACHFTGDAVALTSRTKNIGFEAAAKLFRPDAELAHTLVNPYTDEMLDSYLTAETSQAAVTNYLITARKELRTAAPGIRLHKQLAEMHILHPGSNDLLPTSLGLVANEDIPVTLRCLCGPKYRRAAHLLYPYTYAGRIMYLRTQSFEGGPQPPETINVVRDDVGIFMEENIKPGTDAVVIGLNESTACMMYKRFADESAATPPVIATLSFPLPYSYNHLKQIMIVSIPSAPLTLLQGLRFYAQDPIANTDCTPQIYVLAPDDRKAVLHTLPTKQLTAFDPHRGWHHTLQHWLITRMRELYEAANMAEIYQALNYVDLTDAQREALTHSAPGPHGVPLPQPVINALRAPRYREGMFALANETQILQTPSGFYRIPRGTAGRQLVGNIPFTIDECILTRDNKTVYNCRFHISQPQVMDVPGQLISADCQTPALLQAAVERILRRAGLNTYVAFYGGRDTSWRDIISRLAENKPLRREIAALGIDDSFDVHFPNVTLRPSSKEIVEQKRIFQIPEHVLQTYGGLRPTAELPAPREAFARIVEHVDNIWVAAFMAGVGHVVHQLMTGLLYATQNRAFVPRHLLYVDSAPGLWLNTFRQVNALFTGFGDPIQMPTTYTTHVKELQMLGTLPALRQLPHIRAARLQKLLTELPVGLISTISSELAMGVMVDPATTFVVLPEELPQQPVQKLHDEDLIELQHVLPAMLLQVLAQQPTKLRVSELAHSDTPAAAGYHYLCDILDVTPTAEVQALLTPYYTALGFNDVFTFYTRLHEIVCVKDDKYRIRIKYTAKRKKGEEIPQVYVLRDRGMVLIHKGLILVANKLDSLNMFNCASLTTEMGEKGHLSTNEQPGNINAAHYWTLNIEVWDKYVISRQLELNEPVTAGNAIMLPRLIA